jgi:two-component system sensor histidine kinase YesM
MNKAGQIVSAENKEVLHRNILDILDIGRDKFAELERERKVMIDQQNRTYMLSLQQSDKMNWQIISRVTMDEYMKDRRIIERFIWIVGALCLVFAFISSYYISNTVTKPIQKLVKIMRQIKKGDMSVRMETVDNHEIDMLTRGFNSLMDRVQTLLEEIVVEQQAKQQFEFKLIQSQMNPHFLYNSLETILSLNKLGRHDEAMQVIRTLAEFYRLSLSRGSDVIKISDEIQIIRDYLEIQKVRYSQYMSYTLNFQDDIMDYSVPKLTLQPLVENAIYHGLKSRGNRGKLELRGFLENERVVLVVSDDGAGIPAGKIAMLLGENRPQPGKEISFGLASVDRRIKLLYGYEYGLQIESEIGGYTKIIVTIPAIKMEG